MNRENILAVADAIEKHSIPDLGFNMGDFVREADSKHYGDRSGHSCGTVACIAGWTRRIRTGVPVEPIHVDDFDWVKEADWLGVDAGGGDYEEHSLAHDLFYGRGLRKSMFDVTPADAAAVLRHLAETGEVDWNRALSPTEGERG